MNLPARASGNVVAGLIIAALGCAFWAVLLLDAQDCFRLFIGAAAFILLCFARRILRAICGWKPRFSRPRPPARPLILRLRDSGPIDGRTPHPSRNCKPKT